MLVKTRTTLIKTGPHYGKQEFFWQGKWHFLKWISKRETLNVAILKETKYL
jgi:hypothetical protein